MSIRPNFCQDCGKRLVEAGIHTCSPAYAVARADAAAQRQPLKVEEYTKLAHRIASKYSHRSDPSFVAYTFLPHTLEQFVQAIEAAHRIGGQA